MKYPDTHRCAATHCTRQCDRKYLMCRDHWAMVPRPIQSAVYATHNPAASPTREYVSAVTAAIEAVAKAEGKPTIQPPPLLPLDPPTPKPVLSVESIEAARRAVRVLASELNLPEPETKRRLWLYVQEHARAEIGGDFNASQITPQIIANAAMDLRSQTLGNQRAAAGLTRAELFTKGQLLKAHAKCRHQICGVDIHFAETASGKKTPLNLDGTPHWASCPGYKEFKRK